MYPNPVTTADLDTAEPLSLRQPEEDSLLAAAVMAEMNGGELDIGNISVISDLMKSFNYGGSDQQRSLSLTRTDLLRMVGATLNVLREREDMARTLHDELQTTRRQLAEAERAASTDPLTGLKNRKGFEEAYASEIARMERGESMGGVLIMIDLNHFKPINDTYGHDVGDQCLKAVGAALSTSIRGTDTAVRLGGDEFVLLLTNTTEAHAQAQLKRFEDHINSLRVPTEKGFVSIGASMGIQAFTSDQSDLSAVLHAADTKMYDAKQAKNAARGASIIGPVAPNLG